MHTSELIDRAIRLYCRTSGKYEPIPAIGLCELKNEGRKQFVELNNSHGLLARYAVGAKRLRRVLLDGKTR